MIYENKNKSTFLNKAMKTTINVSKIVQFLFKKYTSGEIDAYGAHSFWEMVYLESGEATVSFDNSQIHLFPGDAIFLKPGQNHSIVSQNNSGGTLFFILFKSDSEAMRLFEDYKISLDKEQKALIYKLYDEAKNIFSFDAKYKSSETFSSVGLLNQVPLGAQQLFKIYLEELLISIGRIIEKNSYIITYTSKEELETLVFQKAVEKISQSIYTDFSFDTLIESLGYGRTYISTVFKKHSGMSVIEYYTLLKIKEAKKLLKEKNLSVSAIAEKLNFTNQYYFSRVFKKVEGKSPTEYKKGDV
ncbi:MAG: helix-turn-helix transcriptional regulator [Clostridia bacterium]|nr:helix-turn-helix transcriptional regulator [Clostridia bacterium]